MFNLYKVPAYGRQRTHLPTMADTYCEILLEHSRRKINRVIENCTFEASSSVYERFFLDCSREIRIITPSIEKQIFDRNGILDASRVFLGRDNVKLTLDLLVQDQQDIDNMRSTEFFRTVFDSASGTDKLDIKLYKTHRNNFLTGFPSVSFGDDRMYRKRICQDNDHCSINASADVNFNDPKLVKSLKDSVLNDLGKYTLWKTLDKYTLWKT